MPPKTIYTKEKVIRAAVSVVETKGIHALTARSVAAKLGCSTAPVYHHFATMDELALSVMKDTQKLLLEYTSRPYTDHVFLNMGTGVAMFACQHRQLYRALMLEGDSYRDVIHEFLDILESEMTRDTRFTSLPESERRLLLNKMWTYTHGLASLICVGLKKNCNQQEIIKSLTEVGADVIGATLARHKTNHKRG